MKNITLKLPSIHCEACTKLVKMSLSWVKWIADPKIDIENKSMTLNINEELITKEELIHLIKEDAWHTAI